MSKTYKHSRILKENKQPHKKKQRRICKETSSKTYSGQKAYEWVSCITTHQDKLQMKTTMRYHLTFVRLTHIKNKNNQCWCGCSKKGPSYTVGGNTKCSRFLGTLLNKLEIDVFYEPVLILLDIETTSGNNKCPNNSQHWTGL